MDYKQYKDDMILRDYLAYDRTRMALVRTFLAIVRTALGLFATGIGLVIAHNAIVQLYLGYILIVVACGVLVYGFYYGIRTKKKLDTLNLDA